MPASIFVEVETTDDAALPEVWPIYNRMGNVVSISIVEGAADEPGLHLTL